MLREPDTYAVECILLFCPVFIFFLQHLPARLLLVIIPVYESILVCA